MKKSLPNFKKNIYLIVFIILFSGCKNEVNVQPVYANFKTDLESINMFGKVKKYSQSKANFKHSSKTETLKATLQIKEEFTKLGSLKKVTTYNNFGKTKGTTENFFNKDNTLLKSVTLKNDKTIYAFELIHFDSIKNIYEHKIVLNDSLSYKTISKFNSFNDLQQEITIKKRDTSIVNFKYKYDSLKNIIESQRFDKLDKNTSKFKYDKNGNLIESITGTDYYKFKSIIQYNNDRIVKITQYNSFEDEPEYKEKITEYDPFYNPINEKIFQGTDINRELKSKYEFDKHGNWTKKTVYLKEHFTNSKEFIPIYIEIREIEYWK